RFSQYLTNVVPLVSGSPEHQNGTMFVAESSDDPSKFHTGVDLTGPSFVQRAARQFDRPSHEFEAVQLGRVAPQPAAERHHKEPMLLRRFRSPNTVEITRNLRDRVFHELCSGTMIVKEGMRPLTRLLPDLMAGQSHIWSNRSPCLINVPVPPNEYSPYTRHNAPHP
ncbi:MAG TPA: hypothetical protein VGG95_12960, partial [Edaphobacter sp.]